MVNRVSYKETVGAGATKTIVIPPENIELRDFTFLSYPNIAMTGNIDFGIYDEIDGVMWHTLKSVTFTNEKKIAFFSPEVDGNFPRMFPATRKGNFAGSDLVVDDRFRLACQVVNGGAGDIEIVLHFMKIYSDADY